MAQQVKQEIKLNFGMYTGGVEKTGQDFSNPMEDVFEEVPPFAYDEETGEFLNKSSFPKLVKVGQVNVQEKIQSYFEDVDIYTILAKFAMSGDESLLKRQVGFYGDIAGVPDNIHDFDSYVTGNLAALKKVSPELANVVLNENSSEADIRAAVDKYASSIAKAKEEKNSEVEK